MSPRHLVAMKGVVRQRSPIVEEGTPIVEEGTR